MPSASSGVGVRELMSGIKRNVVLIALCAFLAAFVGWGVGILLPSKYEAEGLLVIDTKEFSIPELQTIRSARTAEPWGGRSEARILTSPELIRQTVRDLALKYDPSFNPTLRASKLSILKRFPGLPQFAYDLIDSTVAEPVTDASIEPIIVEGITRALRVNSEERSYAIELSFTGRDPQSSAQFVNALMERYLANEVQAKRAPAMRAQAELKAKVDQLFATLEMTRQEIRRLESQDELLTSGAATIRAQELEDVSAERRRVANDRLVVSGELSQIRASIAAGQYSVPNADRETPRLRALWQAEAELRRTLAEREVELGRNHPVMQTLRRELAENQREVAAEIGQIAAAIERQLQTFAAREQQLANRIASARSDAAVSAEGRTVLDQLRAEAESQQALFDEYRQRYEATLTSEDLFTADARIVSRAIAPHKSTNPSPAVLGMAGLLLGGMGAVAWVVGRQYLNDGVETLHEAAGVTGLPALGGIPRVGGIFGDTLIADHVADNPKSAVTETVRGILFRIQNPEAGSIPAKVVMVTSPMPRDGKSSLVTSMARVAARDGLRVLAIDCDFRKPALADHIGVVPRWWLNDYLDESLELSDALVQDPKGPCHFLLSKPVVNCTKGFLEQTRLKKLIEETRDFYDLILIDTPPIMKVVDPLILSQHADATVMVVSWREVSRQLIREGIERLETTSTPLIGLVMSRIGGKVPENYVYGGYGTTE